MPAPSLSEGGEGIGSSLWHLLPDVDAHREFVDVDADEVVVRVDADAGAGPQGWGNTKGGFNIG